MHRANVSFRILSAAVVLWTLAVRHWLASADEPRPSAANKVTCEFQQVLDGVGYVHILGPTSDNCVYVVGPVGDALIIDAYWARSANELIAALEAAGVKPRHVRAIIVTHGHDDHCGGAGAVAKWSHAPIWAHLATATEIEDPWGGFARPGSVFPNTTMADRDKFHSRAGEPARVDRLLREGDVIEHEGLKLEVLHTPGHDRGAIAVFERTRHWVFSGDLTQRGGKGWLGLLTDVSSQRRSLIRVRDLKPEWCFGGHGAPLSDVATVQGELNSALDWLNTLENSLLDSLREKSPLRTIDLTRAAWRKVLEREGANTAESQEVGDPREYSIVSVNAMLLDLARRGLVMVQNVSPGYANPTTRMVENPWTVPKFTDPFGNVQDYPSTKEGLDEGVRRDVFEIHAHRAWTHLNWDLDSPPGPWWDGPIEGEQAHPDWYNETVDVRRGLPVPSNDMLFIYKTGRDAIQRQFGATPLAVTVRQGRGLEHDNGRLAVMAGYGVGRWTYLGPDHVIRFSIPQMAPEQVGCHDIDLVAKTDVELTDKAVDEQSPGVLRSTRVVGGRVPFDLFDPNWPDRWKHKRWIGFNEYCAYLHSHVEAPVSGGLMLDLDYDAHYCRHFMKKPSTWTLEPAEDYQKKIGNGAIVSVDGKAEQQPLASRMVITIPPGVGRHRVEVRTAKEPASLDRMRQRQLEHVMLVYAPESEGSARDILRYAAQCNQRLAQWFQPAAPVAQKVYWMARKDWRNKPETYGFPYANGSDACLPASDVDLPTQLTYIAESMAIPAGGPSVDRMIRLLQLPEGAGPRELYTELKQSRDFFLVFTAYFILPHELTHGFCNHLAYPQQPRWCYEGIAQWAAYKIHGQLRSQREADMIDQYYQLLWERATGLKVRDFARADELGAASLDTPNYAWYHAGLLRMFRQLEEMKGGELLPALLEAIGRRHAGARSVPQDQMIQTFSEVIGRDLKPWFKERWNLGGTEAPRQTQTLAKRAHSSTRD